MWVLFVSVFVISAITNSLSMVIGMRMGTRRHRETVERMWKLVADGMVLMQRDEEPTWRAMIASEMERQHVHA